MDQEKLAERIAETTPPSKVPDSPIKELSVDNDHDKDKAAQAAKVRPEREAGFKDYIRIFSYAKKWDYFLMAVAAVASIGAGIVRLYHHRPPCYVLTYHLTRYRLCR